MGPPNGKPEVQEVREQDRFLPIANISRIMKKSLPPNAKIAKDAKETVQECVSEFISFVTSEASEKCQKEKRKTINGEDLLWAMSTLGFNKYVEPLKHYLTKYREVNKEDSNNKKKEQQKKQVAQAAQQATQQAAQHERMFLQQQQAQQAQQQAQQQMQQQMQQGQ